MPRTLRSAGGGLSIKAFHVRVLLHTLLRRQPIARVRLARETHLSTTTVTNLIAELIEQGIVVEAGADQTAVRAGAGRPPQALRLQPAGRCALGVYIGARRIRVGLVDLQANVLAHQVVELQPDEPAEQALARTLEACRALVRDHLDNPTGGSAPPIVGVGVGAAGLVQSQTGINVLAPNLGWHNLPLRERFAQALNLPAVVDNNVRCMALAESLYGVGRNVRALAYVYARVGVGAGLVVDGALYHGADAGAGEIGHWVMTPSGGALCSCGNRGCLETYISELTLLNAAEALQPDLTYGRAEPLRVIFDAARDGHLALVELLEERAYYLGLALANLINVLNPELIMLGGWLADAFDLIAPVAESTMRQRAFGGIGAGVDLLPTTFGGYCGVIGAAVLALESFVFNAPPAPA